MPLCLVNLLLTLLHFAGHTLTLPRNKLQALITYVLRSCATKE